MTRFRELRDAHNKAMEDMAATVEAKELVHVQAMNNLERKLLIDKGNMQKVMTTSAMTGVVYSTVQ